MKKFWLNKILVEFTVWRLALFGVAFLSVYLFPVFGDRFPYYREYLISTGLPYWIWGFGNFDGVHYLRIAQQGYKFDFTQVFFPLYPLLIRLFSLNQFYFWSGILLSNLFLIGALTVLYKLWLIDYKVEVINKALVLLLAFPTAFYLGSIYTESLLILLIATSFYFLRQDKLIWSGILAALASFTRVFGMLLFPIIAFEVYKKFKNHIFKVEDLIGLALSPLGLVGYMVYLKISFNNPFYFLTAQPAFGAQRSALPLVLLPQVLYRYIKILTTLPIYSLGFFNAFLELGSTTFLILLLIYAFRKINWTYWFFGLGCLFLPTLTGTLSSMPRYVLMSFLLFPILVARVGKYYNWLVIFYIFLQIILLMMFIRGYWVA